MNKSEEFVDIFNKLEQHLSKNSKKDTYITFSRKVIDSNNQIVKKYKDELLSLAALRNAIVHSPKIGGKPIAEPHESTVRRMNELFMKISKPQRVYPLFKFDVIGAQEEDYINDILITMKTNSFSQFPIYNEDDTVLELISTNTISRWLSSKIEAEGSFLMENVKVKDFIPEVEYVNNYRFIAQDKTVDDAYQMFINQINNNKRNLDAVFITKNGKSSEKLVGLITIEDIANIV